MRLKKLLVSGFKSFVDPTDIRLPSDLVGIVGPNGCGKSNVIDAVRWVMGESSARTLRGDNMADVIFNGSSARKPVGKASVELIFDNEGGKAPGNYAQFAEISVKRTLTRDDQSVYRINNIKTRRKDVLDLFRGTGLGPRSYSIIEQGMVSRIVEARPEDLRAFVEEAAGTSRYKDRRRETENRIAHTRENLDRVADIENELDKQLRRLKKQSTSAERYQTLKSEQQEIDRQLHVLSLNRLNDEVSEQDGLTEKCETRLQQCLAHQRETEAMIESLRQQQADAHESNNQIQQEFYQSGAEITNLEQRIQHQTENIRRQTEEIKRLESSKIDCQRQIDAETQTGTALQQRLHAMSPDFESFQQSLAEAESQLADSEEILRHQLVEMEAFNERSRQPAQQVEVQKSRIDYLQRQLVHEKQGKVRLNEQITLLRGQISSTNVDLLRAEVEDMEQKHEQAENRFNLLEQELKQIYAQIEQKREAAADLRTRLQEAVSRLQSLQEIQTASLGTDSEDIDGWLSDNDLGQVPRLANRIRVADGWERAADRVLNGYLNALCTDDMSDLSIELFADRPDCDLAMVCADQTDASPASTARQSVGRIALPAMADKIIAGASHVAGLIAGVHVAESLEQGLEHRHQLTGGECIVTRQGELMGANWISFASRSQIETGVLVREDEIAQLLNKKQQIAGRLELEEQAIATVDEQRNQQAVELESRRNSLNDMRSELSAVRNRFGREETQHLGACEHLRKMSAELAELETRVVGEEAEIENAGRLLVSAVQETGSFEQEREKLIDRRNQLGTEVTEKRAVVDQIREKHHDKVLSRQRLEADAETVRANMQRFADDLARVEARLSELRQSDSSPGGSVPMLEEKLDQLLREKLEIDQRFTASKELVSGFENSIREANDLRTGQVQQVDEARAVLDREKLARQEVMVRRDTLIETIDSQQWSIDEYAQQLPGDASVEDWQAKLAELETRIDRIGPVNLVAIEEFNEQNQRRQYLHKQHQDLAEALDTLETVMRKIDHETRSRFRQTFDTINAGFNRFFPKLFGGGSAQLFLTGEDLLTAGIGVMARPPGKRNSHIHLLSGGEKALTAVALLFSLFELNPAPFCMLDEVDAPLDDANVDRYCETLKALADKSQMIVITHNKITMSAMDLLVGVTMEEAGISRLVSVDVEQAMEIVAQ